MANEEQVEMLRMSFWIWNRWRMENPEARIDLEGANFMQAYLVRANLNRASLSRAFFTEANLASAGLTAADLQEAILSRADLRNADLQEANLSQAKLIGTFFGAANLVRAVLVDAELTSANLTAANLQEANLQGAKFRNADLQEANLSQAKLQNASLQGAHLFKANLTAADLRKVDIREATFQEANFQGANLSQSRAGGTDFANLDFTQTIGLDEVAHASPSTIGTDTLQRSQGKIPEVFLRGCGLPDWEIEGAKLHNPELNNEQVNEILYKMFALRATQALQVSPLFISYSHGDSEFVNKIGKSLTKKGVRYWRDIHEMKAGRMEKQIDRAISQNPTVLLVISENSLSSDWVQHEVRMARGLEKEMGRDVLCPVALDDSWKSSRWPKRVMEQIMEYNILDFSAWEDDVKFEGMFRKLIDGLELFYKGEDHGK